MNKRKREDSISEDCMMEVQVSKDADPCYGESVPPQCLRMLDEIMKSGSAQLVERSQNPLGVSPLGNHVKRINGYEIAELDEFMSTVDSRLKQTVMTKIVTISDQMKFLRQQLVNAVQEAQESSTLNHTPCNFRKVPGKVYYLYQRPSGQNYFSLLSPADWNEKPPHHFCGSYLYDHDYTWKKVSSSTF